MPTNALDDLNLARTTLIGEALSLAVAKNGKLLFKSKSRGVSDLLAMINEISQLAEGASLADNIVGRAAALLCVYSKITNVYGSTMSEGAIPIFKANGIQFEYGTLVSKILNREKNGICPFEKAVSGVENPRDALDKLRSLEFG